MSFIAGTGEVRRRELVTYVNVATSGSSSPVWEAIGVKIEESAIEYNVDSSTVTDILGITTTTANKFEPQQSFDPFTLRKDRGKLASILFDIMVKQKDPTKLSNFEVLTVYAFDGAEGEYTADKQSGCTIIPTSLGGGSTVDMPIEVHYSNDSVMGTVDKLANPTFTPNAA